MIFDPETFGHLGIIHLIGHHCSQCGSKLRTNNCQNLQLHGCEADPYHEQTVKTAESGWWFQLIPEASLI